MSDDAPQKLPPVTEFAVAALLFVVIGGIDLAAHLPEHVPLVIPFALLGASGLMIIAAIASLSRVHAFAWRTFFRVFGWALLAYVVIAGMLEYVFLYDGTSGGPLVVLSLSLLVYGLVVPLLLAFSVARYQPPDAPAASS
jgi:hypothetical protein